MNASIRTREVALAGAAVALAASAIATAWRGAPGAAFGFWLLACLAGERLWVRLPLGGATVSMASACNVAAMLLLPRAEAMLAAGGAVLVAEIVFVRKPPTRALFNAGQTALAVGAGSLVVHAACGHGPSVPALLSWPGLLALAGAAVAYTGVNTGAVAMAVGLSEGVPPWTAWWTNFGNRFEWLSNAALVALGVMLAVCVSLAGPAALALGVLPLLFAYTGYRQHVARWPRPIAR